MNSTTKRELLFQFTALLDSFRLNIKANCSISVMWKHGDKSVETRNRRELAAGVAKLDEEL